MRKFAVLLVAIVAALAMTGCGSASEPRSEPLVGQWESTGGEKIAMRVDSPTDGIYPVRITGGSVDLKLSAEAAGDMVYEAKPSDTVWSFRLVDEDLLTATASPVGQAPVATSFKRVGD
jgi:hypothetical protein